MVMSAEHRSTFSTLHRQWWRLHVSKKILEWDDKPQTIKSTQTSCIHIHIHDYHWLRYWQWMATNPVPVVQVPVLPVASSCVEKDLCHPISVATPGIIWSYIWQSAPLKRPLRQSSKAQTYWGPIKTRIYTIESTYWQQWLNYTMKFKLQLYEWVM